LEKKFSINSNGKNEVTITLSQEEFEQYKNKAVNKARPHVQLAGFRKGKVPKNLILKHYAVTIEQDAIEEAGQQEFAKAVEEGEIKVVGSPAMIDVRNEGEDKIIVIEYDVYPEFQLNDYKGLKLEEPVHEVTEEEADKEINEILKSQGEFEDTDFIGDESHVVGIKMVELDSETNEPKEGAEAKEEHLYLSDEKIDNNLVDALLEHKIGDKVEYVLEHDATHDEHDGEHSHKYEVEVIDVQKVIPKEFTDEFVKEFTQGKFETAEDFKDDVQFQLQEHWDKQTRSELENQIVMKITQSNQIDVPEAFIDNAADVLLNNFTQQFAHLKEFKNQDFSGMKNEFYPQAENLVKWELIREQIIKDENIEVEDFDLDPLVQKEVERSGGDFEKIKGDMKANENFIMSVLNKKVIDFVLDFAETEEIEFDEYKKNQQGMIEKDHTATDDYEVMEDDEADDSEE